MKQLIVILCCVFLIGCSDKLVEQTRGYINAKIAPEWEVLEISRSLDEGDYDKVWVCLQNFSEYGGVTGWFWYKDGKLITKNLTHSGWEL